MGVRFIGGIFGRKARTVVNEEIRFALTYVLLTLQRTIPTQVAEITGAYRNSIRTLIVQGGSGTIGSVYSESEEASTLEYGSPSIFPPIERIQAWTEAVGITPSEDLAHASMINAFRFSNRVSGQSLIPYKAMESWVNARGITPDPEKSQTALARAIAYKMARDGVAAKEPFKNAYNKSYRLINDTLGILLAIRIARRLS